LKTNPLSKNKALDLIQSINGMTNQLMNNDGDFNMSAFDNVPHNQTQAL